MSNYTFPFIYHLESPFFFFFFCRPIFINLQLHNIHTDQDESTPAILIMHYWKICSHLLLHLYQHHRYIFTTYICNTADKFSQHAGVQGGEDPQDALSCRSLSLKEPLIIGLYCGKWPIKIRHPMGLCNPVSTWIRFSNRVAQTNMMQLSCKSLSANYPLILGLFAENEKPKIRHHMPLHNLVLTSRAIYRGSSRSRSHSLVHLECHFSNFKTPSNM